MTIGMSAAHNMTNKYSPRAKSAPKRTAKVLFPEILSPSMSRRLLTTKIPVAKNPGASPAKMTAGLISKDCT